jgi:hypothetical protein
MVPSHRYAPMNYSCPFVRHWSIHGPCGYVHRALLTFILTHLVVPVSLLSRWVFFVHIDICSTWDANSTKSGHLWPSSLFGSLTCFLGFVCECGLLQPHSYDNFLFQHNFEVFLVLLKQANCTVYFLMNQTF